MSNETYNISLNQQEFKILLESLLYSSSPSINSNWYVEDAEQICNLACKLRVSNPNILTENIYLNEDWRREYENNALSVSDEFFCKKIVDFFPEIEEDTFL